MEPQLDNKVLSSFYQWFDHTLLNEGQAYVIKSGVFFDQEDKRLGSTHKYASPHKQWVSDLSVSGAHIPTGVYEDQTFVPFTGNQFFADWNNGRVISTTDRSEPISGKYSTKNFNLYVVNEPEEKILFQNKYEYNNFYSLPASGIAPYTMALPACFINFEATDNETYAMGSSDFQEEKFKVRVILASNRLEDIDGCISLFRQKKDKCFSLLNYSDDPYDAYGGTKSSFPSGYNYIDTVSSEERELIHINKVKSSKMFAASHEFMPQGMQVAFINFDLVYFRIP
jgi:hypothetical protein